MGSCRGLNLLLGLTHADLGGPVAWVAAVGYGLYVAGITVVSRSETRRRSRRLLSGLDCKTGPHGFGAAALAHRRFPPPDRPT